MKTMIHFSMLILALLIAGSSAFAQENGNTSNAGRRGRVVTKSIIVVQSNGDAVISNDGGKNWRGIDPVKSNRNQSECRRQSNTTEKQPTAASTTYTEAFEIAPSATPIAVSSPSHAA